MSEAQLRERKFPPAASDGADGERAVGKTAGKTGVKTVREAVGEVVAPRDADHTKGTEVSEKATGEAAGEVAGWLQIWALCAELMDEMIGVKNQPRKLLKILNVLLAGLLMIAGFFVVHFVRLDTGAEVRVDPLSLVPQDPGPTFPSLRVLVRGQKWLQIFEWLAHRPNIISGMLIGFFAFLLIFIFFVNAIISAAIAVLETQAENEKQATQAAVDSTAMDSTVDSTATDSTAMDSVETKKDK